MNNSKSKIESNEEKIKYDKRQDRKWIIFIFSFPALAVIAGIISIYIVIIHPDPEIDKTVNRFGLAPIVEEKSSNTNDSARESE